MPAEKSARQSVRRNLRNRSVRRTTRTVMGAALTAIESGDAGAETTVRQAISLLDVAVRKGVMHKNTASRTKSRLTTRLNKMGQSGA
ncbi:MAG TPA: 30S ribosomal protein S20 [Dehalococcoidia bacterium]|nr:30S ribosomal protein S20 [Dehalococcoidia bacterium]